MDGHQREGEMSAVVSVYYVLCTSPFCLLTSIACVPMLPSAQSRSRCVEFQALLVTILQVYNVTPYLKFHPGGADYLMLGAGKEATALFNKYHRWVNIDMMMNACLVGLLAPRRPAAEQA